MAMTLASIFRQSYYFDVDKSQNPYDMVGVI